mmetsp:Transcript_15596/g.34062  ORF Transcript_15596/g.34062 Transcript_15596/m.34062 type:complete len:351 (+) Transcript_15596:279-1331(+)|eukprot:CAMPEP_0168732940 /NCGR_PEP_ID=MMETSP0724-20121128/8025_1 /TAXON_ID=265536 /ORGANISM="Amphiprora sp., Strain CCMP467" /LENGTH=350 /DNA_ID=CAMNT_0008779965 /DNA_START=139 /DNA_END=1191 /DNA_ORIENTATION=+
MILTQLTAVSVTKKRRQQQCCIDEEASTVTQTTSCTSSSFTTATPYEAEAEEEEVSSMDSSSSSSSSSSRHVRFSPHPPIYHNDPYASDRDCSAEWYSEHEILRFKSLRKALVRYLWSLEKGNNHNKKQHAAATQRMRRLNNKNLGVPPRHRHHHQHRAPSPTATAVQSFTSTLKDFYQSVCEPARLPSINNEPADATRATATLYLSPLRKRQLAQLYQTSNDGSHNASTSRLFSELATVNEEPSSNSIAANSNDSGSNNDLQLLAYEWIGLEGQLIPYLRQSSMRRSVYMSKSVRDLQDQYAFYQGQGNGDSDGADLGLQREIQSCCQVYSYATVLLAQALAQSRAQME